MESSISKILGLSFIAVGVFSIIGGLSIPASIKVILFGISLIILSFSITLQNDRIKEKYGKNKIEKISLLFFIVFLLCLFTSIIIYEKPLYEMLNDIDREDISRTCRLKAESECTKYGILPEGWKGTEYLYHVNGSNLYSTCYGIYKCENCEECGFNII